MSASRRFDSARFCGFPAIPAGRIRRWAVLASLLSGMCMCASARAADTPATRPFAAYQGGGPLLGQGPSLKPPPMKLRWTYQVSDRERAEIEGSPVIAGDNVLVADGRGTLHCLNLSSGRPRWKYQTSSSFVTTPLVCDGRVMLGDMDGIFHAVNVDDGRRLWTVDVESAMHSSPNIAGSLVLFGTDAADIVCLNAGDGKVIWKQKAGDRVNAAPAISGTMAFFSGCDAHLRAVDIEAGREVFSVELGAVAPGSAIVVDGRAVVGTDRGRVVCVDIAARRQQWVYDGVENEMMVYATPACADGIVVTGARDRQVHGIDLATGKRIWVFPTRGEVDAPPLIADGRVYIGSRDRKLYVLDLKTGRRLWDFTAARGIVAGAASGGGCLVVADMAGNVYCLEPQ